MMSQDELQASATDQTPADELARIAIDEVIHHWFNGGEEGWPDLFPSERRLIAKEIIAALRANGIELMLTHAPIVPEV